MLPSGVLFSWAVPESGTFVVASRGLTRGLRAVTRAGQPLQVAEAVVVALQDVVTVGADAIAAGVVLLRLAQPACSGLHLTLELVPVAREP